MKQALIKALVFYAIGYAVVMLTYLKMGHEYIHAPAPYHFVIFIIFVVGSIWFIISTLIYLTKGTKAQLGYLIPNGINMAIICGGLYISLYPNNAKETAQKPAKELRVEHQGDSTMMYHWNNLIYLNVNDSVIFDVKDSVISDFTY